MTSRSCAPTADTRSSRAAWRAFLPGDAVTLLLETVPLYLLFEGSLVLASIVERRAGRRQAAGVV